MQPESYIEDSGCLVSLRIVDDCRNENIYLEKVNLKKDLGLICFIQKSTELTTTYLLLTLTINYYSFYHAFNEFRYILKGTFHMESLGTFMCVFSKGTNI